MSLAHRRYRLSMWILALFLAFPGVRAAVAGGEAPAAAAPTVRWPLDLPARWLTSNFMEYRGGRYHAGVDFKTRETDGFPAFAVESGWISRVRATPGGYGRAVYLRGDSGRTYVYAHLGRFNDRIAALVGAAQAREGGYRVELEPGVDAFPVARGEVLGLTGQSGTTGPHLHFEVRDAAGRPIDPLTAGFAVRDTIAPVIHHLRAVPATAAARLEGEPAARRLPVAGQPWAGGLAPALRVSGPVAFSARIVDGTDPAGHRLEPWLIELRLDGEVVYRRANETFDFAANAQQRLEWLEGAGLREQWLHKAPGVAVAGREGGEWFLGADGQGLSDGRHQLELVAIDRAGNRSAIAWELVVAAPGVGQPVPAPAWSADPVAITVDGNSGEMVVLTPLFAVLPAAVSGVEVLRLDPGDVGGVLAPVCVVAARTVVAPAQRRQAAVQGLVPVGGAVRWEAAAWPVEGAPLVAIGSDLIPGWIPAHGTVGDQVSMYRWDDPVWIPAGPLLPPAGDGGDYRFALAKPGLHAAMRDTLPPVIAAGGLNAVPHAGFGTTVAGVTPPRWSILPVGVTDAGSGVAAASIAARWDGRPLIVEPDLLRDRVLVELPDSTRAGDHVLELEIADGAGHRARTNLAVRCGPSATTGR